MVNLQNVFAQTEQRANTNSIFGSFQRRTTKIHSVKNMSMIERNLFCLLFLHKRLIFAEIFCANPWHRTCDPFFLRRFIAHIIGSFGDQFGENIIVAKIWGKRYWSKKWGEIQNGPI